MDLTRGKLRVRVQRPSQTVGSMAGRGVLSIPAGVMDAPAAAFVLKQLPNTRAMKLIGSQICQQMRKFFYLPLARRERRSHDDAVAHPCARHDAFATGTHRLRTPRIPRACAQPRAGVGQSPHCHVLPGHAIPPRAPVPRSTRATPNIARRGLCAPPRQAHSECMRQSISTRWTALPARAQQLFARESPHDGSSRWPDAVDTSRDRLVVAIHHAVLHYASTA